jgi:hypothetical protein
VRLKEKGKRLKTEGKEVDIESWREGNYNYEC